MDFNQFTEKLQEAFTLRNPWPVRGVSSSWTLSISW
jgi:hypothetical protein